MYLFWNISLMICFSVSVMFVGSENTDLPPPKNLNFIWETPFRLSLTWEEPEDLDPYCKVNYTVQVYKSQDCSKKDLDSSKTWKVSQLGHKVNVSNENGLCISVSTNAENCGDRGQSQPVHIILPPPPVRLVTEHNCEYSHNRMKFIWKPTDVVQDLSFYYWSPVNESIIKCVPDETMKTGECVIHNEKLKEIMEIYYLFNGTHNGIPVNNTIEGKYPTQCVKPNKPQLKIRREGQYLQFETYESDSKEFDQICYIYEYTYSKCNKKEKIVNWQIGKMNNQVDYDAACRYKASVQVLFSNDCGSGESDPSDEVEYGENSDPNLPVLLAVIIIPLIVSCCLIVSLVLLRRHKDIIFPKIPEPTLLFKDMLSNNIRTTEDLRSPAAVRLYVPTDEIIESRIRLEPDTPSTNNVPHKPK
ncbi:interleukin-13 receptor subunit alpha-1 [Rhinichthys klamathensis goyatoka]|uniref:interleukin-13 receptor subunit alpha-1 n=1 Tax=Rhinichthys klamathensis goyatoka TaxID=3034132 RepID=UPI0024B5A5DF|nr:interleukin-13 receptor subunit alpha-1 [Rhinichthys klamathensis goyatoka]